MSNVIRMSKSSHELLDEVKGMMTEDSSCMVVFFDEEDILQVAYANVSAERSVFMLEAAKLDILDSI
jgi:hypothetical protein